MSDVFTALPADVRRTRLTAYLAHLTARNGAPDLATERLPEREALLARLLGDAPRYEGEVPTEALRRLMKEGALPQPGDPEAALWMAIAAQVNVGEEYGVRAVLAAHPGEAQTGPIAHIELEELYHTRMLLDAVRLFGVEVELPRPPLVLRAFLNLMAILPRPLANVLILVAECNGIVLFTRMREKAAELFGTDTDVGRRLQALLGEILIDELGHVAFLRASLGPVRLTVARWLSQLIAPTLYKALPANLALFNLGELVREVHALTWERLPADVRARAFNPWEDEGGVGMPIAAH